MPGCRVIPSIHRIHKEKEKKNQKKKEKGYCYYLCKRGHFYFAQKRTFLLCVDMLMEFLDTRESVLIIEEP